MTLFYGSNGLTAVLGIASALGFAGVLFQLVVCIRAQSLKWHVIAPLVFAIAHAIITLTALLSVTPSYSSSHCYANGVMFYVGLIACAMALSNTVLHHVMCRHRTSLLLSAVCKRMTTFHLVSVGCAIAVTTIITQFAFAAGFIHPASCTWNLSDVSLIPGAAPLVLSGVVFAASLLAAFYSSNIKALSPLHVVLYGTLAALLCTYIAFTKGLQDNSSNLAIATAYAVFLFLANLALVVLLWFKGFVSDVNEMEDKMFGLKGACDGPPAGEKPFLNRLRRSSGSSFLSGSLVDDDDLQQRMSTISSVPRKPQGVLDRQSLAQSTQQQSRLREVVTPESEIGMFVNELCTKSKNKAVASEEEVPPHHGVDRAEGAPKKAPKPPTHADPRKTQTEHDTISEDAKGPLGNAHSEEKQSARARSSHSDAASNRSSPPQIVARQPSGHTATDGKVVPSSEPKVPKHTRRVKQTSRSALTVHLNYGDSTTDLVAASTTAPQATPMRPSEKHSHPLHESTPQPVQAPHQLHQSHQSHQSQQSPTRHGIGRRSRYSRASLSTLAEESAEGTCTSKRMQNRSFSRMASRPHRRSFALHQPPSMDSVTASQPQLPARHGPSPTTIAQIRSVLQTCNDGTSTASFRSSSCLLDGSTSCDSAKQDCEPEGFFFEDGPLSQLKQAHRSARARSAADSKVPCHPRSQQQSPPRFRKALSARTSFNQGHGHGKSENDVHRASRRWSQQPSSNTRPRYSAPRDDRLHDELSGHATDEIIYDNPSLAQHTRNKEVPQLIYEDVLVLHGRNSATGQEQGGSRRRSSPQNQPLYDQPHLSSAPLYDVVQIQLPKAAVCSPLRVVLADEHECESDTPTPTMTTEAASSAARETRAEEQEGQRHPRHDASCGKAGFHGDVRNTKSDVSQLLVDSGRTEAGVSETDSSGIYVPLSVMAVQSSPLCVGMTAKSAKSSDRSQPGSGTEMEDESIADAAARLRKDIYNDVIFAFDTAPDQRSMIEFTDPGNVGTLVHKQAFEEIIIDDGLMTLPTSS